MSSERRQQDDRSDPFVSSVYRELSDECTPEHLDHVVLNEARRSARPGYATTISWLRPAAWVTTIGLCLAIVLEVSDMTPQEQPALTAPAEVERGSEESVVATPVVGGGTAPPAAARSSTAPRVDVAGEEMPAAVTEPVKAERPVPAVIETDLFDQDARQLLRDAEDQARLQTESNQESVDTLLEVAPAVGLASDAASERYCEESETADPNAWLACILDLEQQGLLEAAMVERDLLRESFPDAQVPTLTPPPDDSR